MGRLNEACFPQAAAAPRICDSRVQSDGGVWPGGPLVFSASQVFCCVTSKVETSAPLTAVCGVRGHSADGSELKSTRSHQQKDFLTFTVFSVCKDLFLGVRGSKTLMFG